MEPGSSEPGGKRASGSFRFPDWTSMEPGSSEPGGAIKALGQIAQMRKLQWSQVLANPEAEAT